MFLISMSYLEIYNEEVKDLLTGESNMKIRESEVRFLDVTFWSWQLRHRATMFIIFRHKKCSFTPVTPPFRYDLYRILNFLWHDYSRRDLSMWRTVDSSLLRSLMMCLE